jgi:hypothetical protein
MTLMGSVVTFLTLLGGIVKEDLGNLLFRVLSCAFMPWYCAFRYQCYHHSSGRCVWLLAAWSLLLFAISLSFPSLADSLFLL